MVNLLVDSKRPLLQASGPGLSVRFLITQPFEPRALKSLKPSVHDALGATGTGSAFVFLKSFSQLVMIMMQAAALNIVFMLSFMIVVFEGYFFPMYATLSIATPEPRPLEPPPST